MEKLNLKNIVILGAGGFAREVAWLIEEINANKPQWNIVGYIDKDEENVGTVLNGYPILGDNNWFENNKDEIYAICALGESKIRKKVVEELKKYDIKYATLVHPSVLTSKYVNIGEGTIICASNIITTNIEIGKHVIVNLDCTIGHDAVIKDYCTILPSVNVSGNVILGEGCYIGTGSSIIDKKQIGEWTTIGAGAVVVKNIDAYCTAVGAPAKPIKFHNQL